MLQFVHRRGLLEVFDHVGIFGDVLTIEREGRGGHLLHRGHPALVGQRLHLGPYEPRHVTLHVVADGGLHVCQVPVAFGEPCEKAGIEPGDMPPTSEWWARFAT